MARFWEFFEDLDEYVYVTDMDTNELMYMNKRARERYAMQPEDYQGKKCYEVLQKCLAPCPFCNNNELKAGEFNDWRRFDPELGHTLSVRNGIIERNGHRYRIEFACDLDEQEEQAIDTEKILNRLREEEKARAAVLAELATATESAAQYKEYLDMVNDIIGSGLWFMTFDKDGQMDRVVWSQKFREMLGFQDENDFPNTLEAWSDRLHPKDKAATLAAYWETVAGNREYDVKYQLMKKDGEYEWFHAHGRTLTHEDGTPRLFLGIFINITKTVNTQKALDEAYQSANRANAAKTEFMANMSHDIRTPLNAIIGMTAIAAAHQDDPDRVKHCLTQISESSKHLLGLVNDVLDMNRIESGQVTLNIETVDIAELIESFLTMAKPLANAKNQKFEVSIHDIHHEKVFGDAERIQQCLMNLVSNAVKYTPEGGKVSVAFREKPSNRSKRGCFEFVVEDNGIGINEEFLPHVFEPFTRAEDERAIKETGTGLGMAITRTIVQMMSGDIKVESTLNEGSRFTGTIFLELQDVNEEELKQHLLGRAVLVVDDDQDSCESVCEILEELGLKGEWVLTGHEAVERVVERHENQDDYYAVLVDWKMPGMDGVATTQALREAAGPDMPIIIISAYDWSDIETVARAAGATSFINKPIFKSRMIFALEHIDGEQEEAAQLDTLERYKSTDFSEKRALLVEDNQINALITIDIMDMTGMKVDHVWNGKEAVDLMESVEEDTYDIVFMDIQMPIMDGHEATKAMRASNREYLQKIPIVALSANAFAEDVEKSLESGMDRHVAKPLDFDILMDVLQEYL